MNKQPENNVSIFDPSRRKPRPIGVAASRIVLVMPTLEMPRHHPDALFAAVRMIQELVPDEVVHLGDPGEPSHVENRYLSTLRRSYRGAIGFQFSAGLNFSKYDVSPLPPAYELDANWIAVDQPAVPVAIGPGETALRAAIAAGRSVVTAATKRCGVGRQTRIYPDGRRKILIGLEVGHMTNSSSVAPGASTKAHRESVAVAAFEFRADGSSQHHILRYSPQGYHIPEALRQLASVRNYRTAS
ncbi:hypothetical protein [Nocardia sp. XZ_19_385]|uniref:hypothetical protein n=1 Tax=Nocardia sp. XZ_19_385 TaxID=2769488 RepID=UPI00188FC402|nr:hypothetical protein [Nocardia sp. XZ_19_385]